MTSNTTQHNNNKAFTLVELLVVVSIIALLLSILLPGLAKAKHAARLTTCKSNLKQIGTAIYTYAASENDTIPSGPYIPPNPPFGEENDGTLATSQIWDGNTQSYMALGLLIKYGDFTPESLYCPGDDTTNREEEMPKVGTGESAFSSYLYRQNHATTRKPTLAYLGENNGVPVKTLAIDFNSAIDLFPGYSRSSHDGIIINVLFADSSVRHFNNPDNKFSLRNQDLADMHARRADILKDLDALY